MTEGSRLWSGNTTGAGSGAGWVRYRNTTRNAISTSRGAMRDIAEVMTQRYRIGSCPIVGTAPTPGTRPTSLEVPSIKDLT